MLVNDITIDTTVEKRDRNWMIRIYSALEQSPEVQIECHREIVLVKDGKKYSTAGDNGERQYMITKMLSSIMMDTITLPVQYGGYTLSAGQIALALEMLSDKYSESLTTYVKVETAADGSGSVVGAQNLPEGDSLTVYSISRDAVGNFVENVAADSWALTNKTGDIVDGDLVAAVDGKSATLTGALVGTAQIEATSGTLAKTPSGTITIIVPHVSVETAADGSGSVVRAQELPSGNTLTVYAISRDAVGNFVANVAADSWALTDKTGEVVDGDLVAAGDSKSATLTGALAGTAQIEATSGSLTKTPSGVITVVATVVAVLE